MYLFGASGHGKVVHDIVRATGGRVDAFIDDAPAAPTLCGRPVLSGRTGLAPVIVSIGANHVRRLIAGRLGGPFATAVHPSAVVSPTACVGEGTVVMPGAVIGTGATVGRHCIVNTGTVIGPYCHVADFCHIAPHATLCTAVHVGEESMVGVGAVVTDNIHIGSCCTIGARAVVIHNIADNMKQAGVPAKPLVARKADLRGGKLTHRRVVALHERRYPHAA